MRKRRLRLDAELPGKVFGRLTVRETWLEHGNATVRWCRCDCACGTKGHVCRHGNLATGKSKSCGCLMREWWKSMPAPSLKHGMSKTNVYSRFSALKSKGLLGPEWQKFEAFYRDLGEVPFWNAGLVRLDETKPYSPKNCPQGWVSPIVAKRHRRNARRIKIGDEERSLSEWAAIAGVSRQAFQQWIDDTGSVILGLPPRQRTEEDLRRFVYTPRSKGFRIIERNRRNRRKPFSLVPQGSTNGERGKDV